MDESIRRNFYIVSNIKSGTLSIIDSFCNTILKEIVVGKRPFNLATLDSNLIAVACDMSNTISVVNCISGEIKQNYIPNNGIFQVDKINKKILISNTYEIIIYDINFNELLGVIKGFSAIIDLKLNRDGSRIYILDTLLKQLRVYNAINYTLIDLYENLSSNSSYLLISEDEKKAYISAGNNILIVDLNSKKIIELILSEGSMVTGMILKDNTLYASNFGLNRIELINIHTSKVLDFILTSISEPTRLLITDDKTKLLVINRNHKGSGGIDIIDLKSNILIGSIIMNTVNSQPYDVISLSLPNTYVPPVAITNLPQGNQRVTIIAKKIFSAYNENISFPNININLSAHKNSSYTFQNIIFKPGTIVENSELRNRLSTISEFSSIRLIARVNYIIDYLENNKSISINGFFEKPIEFFLDIPQKHNLQDFELNIKTITKLIGNPKIIHNVINFGITTAIELKLIGQDEIYINNSKENYYNEGEDFEAFDDYGGSIFPDETIFPI